MAEIKFAEETDHRYIVFTPQQLAQLKASYIAGESTDRLSARYGIAKCTVRRRLKAMGVTLRKPGRVLQATPEAIQKAATMRRAGHTWAEISKAVGVKSASIESAARRMAKRKEAGID